MGASRHILKFYVSGKRFPEKHSVYFCLNFCITPLPSEIPTYVLNIIHCRFYGGCITRKSYNIYNVNSCF